MTTNIAFLRKSHLRMAVANGNVVTVHDKYGYRVLGSGSFEISQNGYEATLLVEHGFVKQVIK